MINKHLDDLEMFLGVFEACSNSSNLQMTGELIYIGHQVERAIGIHYPTFLRGIG